MVMLFVSIYSNFHSEDISDIVISGSNMENRKRDIYVDTKIKKRKTLFKNITYYYNIGNTIFTSLIHNLVVIDSAAFPPMHCARCIYI